MPKEVGIGSGPERRGWAAAVVELSTVEEVFSGRVGKVGVALARRWKELKRYALRNICIFPCGPGLNKERMVENNHSASLQRCFLVLIYIFVVCPAFRE